MDRGPDDPHHHDRRRSGDAGRHRTGRRVGCPASGRPRRSASGRPGRSRSSWSSCPASRPRRPDLAPGAAGGTGPRPSSCVDVAAVLVVPALPVDKRHNSKIDRTRVGRVGERGARGRTDAQAVRVLVTGATSLLGGAVAARLHARGDDVTVFQRRPSGLGMREVRGDVADRDAVDARGRRRRRRDPRRGQGRGRRTVVGVRGDQHHRYRERARRGARRGRRSVRLRLVTVGRARRALARRASPPGRPIPTRARGNYSRSKATRRTAGARRRRRRVLGRRGPPAPGVGPGRHAAHRSHRRPGPSGSPRDRSAPGAALIDTTYIDNAADAIVAAADRAGGLGGRAFVVSNGQPRPGARAARRHRVGRRTAAAPAARPAPRWRGPRARSSSGCGRASTAPTTRRSPASSPSSCRPRTGSTSAKPERALGWQPAVEPRRGLRAPGAVVPLVATGRVVSQFPPGRRSARSA